MYHAAESNAFAVFQYAAWPLDEVFRRVDPHVVARLFVIALFCVFPQLVLWLPQSMGN